MFLGARAAEQKKQESVTIVNHEHLRWPKLYISSPHPRVRHAEPLFPDSAAWLVPLPIIISVPRMCMMFHVCCMQSLYRLYRLRQWSSSIQPIHNRVCIHDTCESVCNHTSLVLYDHASGVYVTRVTYGNHVIRVMWGPRSRGPGSARHAEISCFRSAIVIRTLTNLSHSVRVQVGDSWVVGSTGVMILFPPSHKGAHLAHAQCLHLWFRGQVGAPGSRHATNMRPACTISFA